MGEQFKILGFQMNKLKIHAVLLALMILVPIPVQAMSVAMIVWRGETDAERGFMEGLRTLGHEAEVTVFNAEQDKRKLGRIIRVDLAESLDQFDYIYTFGTCLLYTSPSPRDS